MGLENTSCPQTQKLKDCAGESATGVCCPSLRGVLARLETRQDLIGSMRAMGGRHVRVVDQDASGIVDRRY